MLPRMFALVPTILLLMSLGFFVLGSTPLLILKHDTAMDSRVIRQVFNYCYGLVAVIAVVACAGVAFSGRAGMAAGLATIAILAFTARRWVLARMDALRTTMHDGDAQAVRRFRGLHVGAIAFNAAQLVAVVWGISQTRL